MGKNIIKEEIVEMLEVIVEQSEVINGYEKKIPQIEIDIILSNIRDLYSKFKLLEKENKFQGAAVAPAIEEPIIQEEIATPEIIKEPEAIKEPEIIVQETAIVEPDPVIAAPIAEVKTPVKEEKIQEVEAAPVIKEEPKEKEIIPPVVIVPPATVPVEEKKIIVPEPTVIPEPEKEEKFELTAEQQEKKTKSKRFSLDLFTNHNTVADKFKDDKKSLNEKHSSSQTDNSLASKMQKHPVKDLKAAIGINEKFKFINELFDGSLQKYNDCITQLNGFAGSEAAFKYMSFLKDEFGWKDNSDAYHELTDLVTRRYSA